MMKKVGEVIIICLFAALLAVGGDRLQDVKQEVVSFEAWNIDAGYEIFTTTRETETERITEWWSIGPDGKELQTSLTIKRGEPIHIEWKKSSETPSGEEVITLEPMSKGKIFP